jgi:hypothetical protein
MGSTVNRDVAQDQKTDINRTRRIYHG